MSQFELVNSYFLVYLEPWSFGTAPMRVTKIIRRTVMEFMTQKLKYLPSISLVFKLFEVLRIVPNLEVVVPTWSYFLLIVARDMQSARLGIAKSPESAR